MRIISICFALVGLLMACDGDRTSSPPPPQTLEFDQGSAVPAEPDNTELPDIPMDDIEDGTELEDVAEGEAEEDNGIRLEVAGGDMLPQRIAECVDQGVAGAVMNGIFSCNEQQLVDCSELTQTQKLLAKSYADEQLSGYLLYGCSTTAEGNANLHYFMLDGAALQVFNLEVQQNTGGG